MKHLGYTIALATALTLASCTAAQMQTAVKAAPTVTQLACTAAQADLALTSAQAKGGAANTVANIGSYVNGGCPLAEGAVTVAANVAADPNGAAWVQGLSAALAATVPPPAAK